jgi:MFS family permease
MSAGGRLCTLRENTRFWVPTIKVRPPDGTVILLSIEFLKRFSTNPFLSQISTIVFLDSILQEGEFVWDEYTQSMIVGSFFLGYILTQLPGGRIGEVMGVKRVFGFSMISSGLLTLLTPMAAKWDAKAMIASRAIMGLCMVCLEERL